MKETLSESGSRGNIRELRNNRYGSDFWASGALDYVD